MKKVTLKSLTLTNFRGEKERTTVFDDVETTISGDNGLGKSRQFDAFIWLLFGKDSQDRKDYNIKTIVDGETSDKVNSTVSAIIDVDGCETTLTRAIVEDWVKPRGKTELVYKGNHTETTWNGAPVNVSEYQKRVSEIIDETVFKMVTNPMFFANMKWQDQRQQLMNLAGTVTDTEIAANNADFKALLDKISGKTLSDFKRELSANKRLLREDLEQIQPRIDQTRKLMPEKEDFKAIEDAIAKLDDKLSKIDKALSNKAELQRQKYESINDIQKSINSLDLQRQNLLSKARMDAEKTEFDRNEKRMGLIRKSTSLRDSIESNKSRLSILHGTRNTLSTDIQSINDKLGELRKSWSCENSRQYDGSDVCQACGQPLPIVMKEKAHMIFQNDKAARLTAIVDEGKNLNEKVAYLEKEIANTDVAIASIVDESNKQETELVRLSTEIGSMPIVKIEVVPANIPEYVKLTDEVNDLKAKMDTMESGKDEPDTLVDEKRRLLAERDECKQKLSKRDLIRQYDVEVGELETRGRDLAQQIADLEKVEYTILQFTKAKIDECEKRINGLFQKVKFKMFEHTIEGNEIETCIPLVEGIPFSVANTAGRINAGIDIINALCRYYDVCAPIFIDNRESVNRLINTQSQIINLVVSKDATLQINYIKK